MFDITQSRDITIDNKIDEIDLSCRDKMIDDDAMKIT